MPLSWNEIKSRALAFSRKWEGETSERAEAQSFWNDFFGVFGIERRRVAIFEKQVKLVRAGEHLKRGRIDAFWKGMLLIEHKSAEQDLDRAFAQAADYFEGLPERDLPRYIIVSDFARFRLYDLEDDAEFEFKLTDLHKKVKHFSFIAGYAPQQIKPQDPVNIHAAEQMGRLHDQLKAAGYVGHPLELFLVRLVFCLFADDTGIFPKQNFRDWLDARTAEDGSDIGPKLAELFQILNTHRDKRQKNLDEQINAFDYINGRLFEEALPLAQFDAKMRATLLDCCALNWGSVSPAIFGALFQTVMDEKARRNLGAHYTSEENILKVIKPLFLDELWAEFNRIKGNKNRLFEFHKKLRTLTFLDPACGCGNFLVITYRELRLLELEILHVLYDSGRQQELNVHHLIRLDVDQFYGIEIEEFPAQIAQVAMWLVDHQMNVRVSEEFGMYFARIPLVTSPHIVNGNALRLDWADVLPPERCSYVLGNPPFVGAKFLNDAQRADVAQVFAGIEGGGLLDLVAAWYVKAARYVPDTNIRCAFVSTNSITQGEQVGVLWGWLLAQGIHIHFAHRTFRWSNEARGMAAVHCVIIGFGAFESGNKIIYEYDDIRGEPHTVKASNINPYLVDAADVVLPRRSNPICDVPEIGIGNKPIDGGNYLFTPEEKAEFVKREPVARRYFRRWLGGDEFINGYERWCLWLGDCPPAELRKMPEAMKRVEAVKHFRLASKSAPTRKLADIPTRFHVENMPTSEYLVIPKVSSERRRFVPIGFLDHKTLSSDLLFVLKGTSLYHVGVLCSTAHNSWVRYTCGRLESRYRYSKDIVYNNFPWPEAPTVAQRQKIDEAAQGVLDARAAFPSASLADLYDPLTMPPTLVKAHHKLDVAVDAAYGRKSFRTDAERVAFLFELYRKYTSLLPSGGIPATKRRAGRKRLT
ncbi:MAG: class I SAM-dependent DNA methyltransferase [Betaproteobacteria bacterium]|nr:class I SAM-dependent DNA methyltransferase [Betaproteobacteria bacterium]